MNDKHYYEVNLFWDFKSKGILSFPGTSDKIEITAQPEKHKWIMEKWTPEHLYVASVSSGLMSTFLLVAGNSKFKFISFESNAIGTIEKIDGKLSVTEIILKPILILSSPHKENKAKQILALSEKAFALSNSIKTKITLEQFIIIK